MTLIWTIEAVEKLQDMMLLPDPVMVKGERVHAVLFVVNPTTPANPFRLATVIVDPPSLPAFTTTFVGLVLTAKSLEW